MWVSTLSDIISAAAIIESTSRTMIATTKAIPRSPAAARRAGASGGCDRRVDTGEESAGAGLYLIQRARIAFAPTAWNRYAPNLDPPRARLGALAPTLVLLCAKSPRSPGCHPRPAAPHSQFASRRFGQLRVLAVARIRACAGSSVRVTAEGAPPCL